MEYIEKNKISSAEKITSNTLRDPSIDALKGFLMVCVVIGHAGTQNLFLNNDILVQLITEIKEIIYLFHMPLFLSVSVLFITKERPWKKEIESIGRIALVFVVWVIVNHVYTLEKSINTILMANWGSGTGILWFLPALISLRLLFLVYLKSNHIVRTSLLLLSLFAIVFGLSLVFTIHQFIPWGIDIAFWVLPLAIILSYRFYHPDKFQIPLSIIITTGILSLTLFYQFEPIKYLTDWHHRVDLAQFLVPENLLGYCAVLISAYCIFSFFLVVRPNALLASIGVYSLPIFLLHTVLMGKYERFLSGYLGGIVGWVGLILTGIVVPVVFSKIVNKISPLFAKIGLR